jgi:hypothetical protein
MYTARQKLQEEHDERAKVYAEKLKEVCSNSYILLVYSMCYILQLNVSEDWLASNHICNSFGDA